MSMRNRKLVYYEGIDQESKVSCIPGCLKSFKQRNINFRFSVSECQTQIKEIVKMKAEKEITKVKLIQSTVYESEEEQITEYKALVFGEIRIKVLYVAEGSKQGVQSFSGILPYQDYVVISREEYRSGVVRPEILLEDMDIKIQGKDSFYGTMLLLLYVRPFCKGESGDCEEKQADTNVQSKYKEEFAQFMIEVPDEMPDAERALHVLTETKIEDVKVIATDEGISFEGQQLSQGKIIVTISCREKITYVAEECTQPVYSFQHENVLISFLILPKDKEVSCLEAEFRDHMAAVVGKIEYEHIEKLSNRKFMVSALINVQVKR